MEPQRYQSCIEACNTCADACDYCSIAGLQDGSFYASELITSADFSGGDVVKIPFATPAVHTSLTGNALTFPTGVAVGSDGSVYVSNGTAFVPQGQVVRLTNR